MSIYIIRHGETLFNRLGKNQGWIDSDLTPEGIEVLRSNFKKINFPFFDLVYCSDLGRAKKTLNILNDYVNYNNQNLHYTNELRERFLGSFEGDVLIKNREYLAKKEGYSSIEEFFDNNSFWDLVEITKKHDYLDLAENYSEFSSRISTLIDRIISEKEDKNVLIVAHANPINYIVEYITQEKNKLTISNGSILKFNQINGDWIVEKIS